jgi:DNA polymerase-1
VGDAVDNVPGVAGVGDKTARQLVTEYGSLDRIYENLSLLKPALRKKLEEGRERAFYSRELVTLLCDTEEDLAQFHPARTDREHFSELCRSLGLQKIEERFLSAETGPEAGAEVPAGDLVVAPRDEILSERELVCVPVDPESREIVLMTPAGRYARFAEGFEKVLGELKDATILVEDYKKTLSVLESQPLPPERVRDFTTAHYLLHPDGPTHDPRALFPGYDGLSPEGRAALLHGEYRTLRERIAEYEGLDDVMGTIDLPLVPILVDMERHGIGCSLDAYGDLERDLASRVGQIEGAIAKVAGERINLNSPKQVGWLLFKKMSLPAGKRTKTGYSTDVTVLEGLVAMGKPYDEVPALLLEYRELTKMLSGFVQPLTKAAEAGKGVIHGTFEPAVTGTGRLSSRDPNLQNLPSFGEWSKRIKEGLHPKGEGNIFVSADYSQVELRVLAHLSGEERLKDSFRSGRDIHTETASWVFSVDPGLVTPELRRVAKMINFGLLYGMSSFGLAQRLAMGRQEAAEIIRRYFTALPAVEAYLEESYDEAKKRGYTRTMMGRIRPLAEVPVSPRDRDGLRRVAVNSPIQGTAADIARKAMVDFGTRYPASGDVRLVLQVHDSLVCECPEDKASETEEALRHLMEQAVQLSVPLRAESKRGKTLADV